MRRKPRPGGAQQFDLTIQSVGAHGDGVGEVTLERNWREETFQVFVPQTLPGELVTARTTDRPNNGGMRAEVVELQSFSEQRIEPDCEHFGACGGCQLQHWDDAAYQAWKQARVVDAVEKAGGDVSSVLPLTGVPAASRRRARIVIAQMENNQAITLGFRMRSEHRVEPIDGCLILRPELKQAVEALKAIAPDILGLGQDSTRSQKATKGKGKNKSDRRRSAVQVEVDLTLADNGLCLALKGKDEASLDTRLSLTDLGKRLDLARITWNDDPVYQPRTPVIRLGDALVALPPNPFLQPSVEGQQSLVEWVLAAVPDSAELVADLYSGMGTFSFPLAERNHEVLAVEGEESAILALEAARRQDERYAKLSGAVRDLDRWAISAEDLNDFDAVVFDPPRAGANNQSKALAQSQVPVIVAVSCNPATFARDAKHLIDGGYRLDWARGLDQFPWTGHVEIVARFVR